MCIRPLTPDFAVLDRQMQPGDIPQIAAAGYVRIINNRPDEETTPENRGEAIAAAARAEDLGYVAVPFRQAELGRGVIATFGEAIKASGPVLAYCRSGTRSATLWALAQAQSGLLPVDAILSTARAAGYDLDQFRPLLTSLSREAG